jgi:type VI protein secretion system component Hcp
MTISAMTPRRRSSVLLRILALATILPALLGNAAHAQLSGWLDFEGSIKGEATDAAHQDWIEIVSFQAGSARTVSSGTDRGLASPLIGGFSLGKFLDRSTPELFRSMTSGSEAFPRVTLDLDMGTEPLVRVLLENVLVTGLSFSAASGDGRPIEMLTLDFTKITFTYFRDALNSTSTGYDLAKGTWSSGGEDGFTDADTDGMPDSWERLYGLSVGTDDSGGDLDGDGLTNMQELQLGTNPASGTSFFKATLQPDPATPGSWQLTWNSVAGKTYVIEWSPDLQTPFTAVRTVTATSTSTVESLAGAGDLGFYRVRPQ